MSSDGIDLSKYRTSARQEYEAVEKELREKVDAFEKTFDVPDDEAEQALVEKLKASIDLVKERAAKAECKECGRIDPSAIVGRCGMCRASDDVKRRHCIPVAPFRGVPERKPGAQKDNSGKRLWKLLPTKAVGLVVDVLGYGAYLAPRPDGTKGYGENNWQGIPTLDYYDAALRHLTAWKLGERLDSASGLPHLAHAACCVLFMLAQCEGVDP